ncbi:MAG TPA: methyltransferase type 12, partial [Pseudonocardiaceae bacterium]
VLHAAFTRGDDVPWRAKAPSRLARFTRTAGFKAALPLFIASAIADRVLAGFVGTRGYANAYRVVAVKN